MTRLEKIRALADLYECSLQGVRILIQRGHIEGAYAVENKKRWSYFFSPDLNERLRAIKLTKRQFMS